MIRTFTDKELRGKGFTADSPLDIVRHVAAECPGLGVRFGDAGWAGRPEMDSWDRLLPCYSQPWKKGIDLITRMTDEIRADLPMPKSVRRRGRWDDNDGEVCVDRVLRGEPDFYRTTRRADSAGPRNVALLLHVGGAALYSPEQMLWRGAAAISALDLLEEAGYSAEVWVWNVARGTFRGACPDSFIACKVKECGEPVELTTMANVVSAWYYRLVCLRAKMTVAPYNSGMGMTSTYLSGWGKYMDVTEGIQRVQVDVAFTKSGALEAARKVLEQVTSHQQGD